MKNGNAHWHAFGMGCGAPRIGRVKGVRSVGVRGDEPEDGSSVAPASDPGDDNYSAGDGQDSVKDDFCVDGDGHVVEHLPAAKRRRKVLRVMSTDVERPGPLKRCAMDVQNLLKVERYFGSYVWGHCFDMDPCFDDSGNVRFTWDE